MNNTNDNNPRRGAGKLLDEATWEALKKAGVAEAELLAEQPFGPLIFAYTRAQAIEDGVLIDITDIARREGFKVPTAMTCGLWAELKVGAGGMGDEAMPALVRGMLRVLMRTIRSIPQNRDSSRVDFRIGSIDAYSLIGPGDEGEPVLTVMLIGED